MTSASQVELRVDSATANSLRALAKCLWGLKDDGTDTLQIIESVAGAMKVAVSQEPLPMHQLRPAIVDAAGDVPANITNSGNVSGATYTWDLTGGGLLTVSKMLAQFHVSDSGASGVALSAPLCDGFIVTYNADNATQANGRLTQVDFAGGNSTTASIADTFIVSSKNPVFPLVLPPNTYITNVYAVAIPSKVAGGTDPTNIIPARLELLVFG